VKAVDYRAMDNRFSLTPEFFRTQRIHSGWQFQSLQQFEGFNQFETGRICNDIFVTRSHCSPAQPYRCQIEHPQPTTLILFGEQGISEFFFRPGGARYIVRPGDLWLINLCGEPLYRLTEPDQVCRMQVLKYSSERIAHALDQPQRLARMGTRAIRVARQCVQPAPFQKLASNPLLTPTDRLLAEAWALELIAQHLGQLLDLPAPEAPAQNVCKQPLDRVIECLSADLCNPPSLDELAALSGMSHSRLNREFKRAYGHTVFSWLRQYRLQQSASALRHTDADITDIAVRLGFSSASHFAASFRQKYGCSPLQYRLQHCR